MPPVNGIIDYSQYGDPMPFGPYAQSEVGELTKALTAGLDINTPGAVAGSGFALRPESLDGTLYNLSFRMEHLRLWPQLLKQEVYNTINEYNVLRAHGSGVAFFHNEGDLPAEDDTTWERMYARVKSMGCTRRYTIMASMVRMAHMQAEAHQTIGGTMWTLEQLERSLFAGNATLLPQAFDGYDQLIANVRDLRGRPLTGDEVNYGAGKVFDAPNYGKATDLYMPVGVDTDFVDDIAPNARYNVQAGPGYVNGHAGMQVKVYDTQRGPISLQPDVFIKFGDIPSSIALGDSAKRPGTPTEAVAMASPTSTLSKFLASDAGSYRYKAVAVNEFGKSAPLELTGTVTVDAGDKVTFSLGDGNPTARYYEIYRSTLGGAATTCKYAFAVIRDPSGTTAIEDNNFYLPGMGRSYLIQQNQEFNKFNRLLRFMKIRLGMVDASFRFMLLLFGNLVVHAPNKALIFINVGRSNRTPANDL